MARIRLLGGMTLMVLLSLTLFLGLERSARSKDARKGARRLVAEALADGTGPQRRSLLFRRAKSIDPTYELSGCERGPQLADRARYAEAAASFRSCLDSDPDQSYAELRYAQALLRARGRDSYVEVRAALKRFLERPATDAVGSQDPASRRSAEQMVRDLEELLTGGLPPTEAGRVSAAELRRILLRRPVRGSSRYDGPRAPLRLAFRPGDAALGSAAKDQLWEVARALQDGSLAGCRIQLEGHTDSIEGRTRLARLEIALRRAAAARDFLVRTCRIGAGVLTVAAFADDYPLAPNDKEEGRATNRRVELVNLTTRDLIRQDARDQPGS
jgi:outer membrane protein OmpA-like peptidoglycan-associated protein